MKTKEVSYLFFRYITLLILALGNLFLISLFIKPLTTHLAFLILQLTNSNVQIFPAIYSSFKEFMIYGYEPSIWVNGNQIILISACIAVSAYYFILILNLSTSMPIKKRILSLLFLISSLLILNTLRIVVFAFLFLNGFEYFDITHKAFWYFGSTILVVMLWFSSVFMFKIKSVPIYTDIKNLISEITRNKKTKRKKK